MQINANSAARATLSVQNRPTSDVNQPVTPKSRETKGKDFVVLSREAVAQSSRPSAQNTPQLSSRKALTYSSNPAPTAPLAPLTPPSTETPTPIAIRTFGQSDIDSINAGYGARAGDKNFSADADANGDGTIDFKDITHVLSNWGQNRV